MFVSKKVFYIISLILTSLRPTYGHVTIQIEPEDLQRFADILIHMGDIQPLIRSTAMTPTRSSRTLSTIKGISRSVLQIMGLMFTLVGANLLSTKFEPFVTSKFEFVAEVQSQQLPTTNVTKPEMLHSEICDHVFGCDENICWRTCGGETSDEEILTKAWCHTTSKSDEIDYKKCDFDHECSPCWECLGQCKSTFKG